MIRKLLIGILLAFSCSMTVAAAETAVTSVSVTVDSDIDAEGAESVSITVRDARYTALGYEWVNKPEEWKAGAVPRIKIHLEPAAGYYFERITSSRVNINGADFSSVKAQEGGLDITVRLNPVEGALPAPERATWEMEDERGYYGRGTWEKSQGASVYELRLYRDGTRVFGVDEVTGTYYDFTSHLKEEGDYYFQVRAVAKTGQKGYLKNSEWTESDRMGITEEGRPNGQGSSHVTLPAAWVKGTAGWWYRRADGGYPANCWEQIDGRWYLFDGNGYMLTGWQNRNGIWYLLEDSGAMLTGWQNRNEKWYLMDDSGAMLTGWQNKNGKRYLLDGSGAMLTGWQQYGNVWYYLNIPNGDMASSTWIDGWRLGPDGAMLSA